MRTFVLTLIIAATASTAGADDRSMTPMRAARPRPGESHLRAGDYPDLPINLHEVSTPLKNGKVRIGSRGGTDFLIDSKGNPLIVYRESKAGNRAVFLAASTNGGTSFARINRVNQGETKIDS